MGHIKVTYREVAKMLASALPIEDEEFGAKVSEYIATIKAMPTHQKLALKCAYVFSRKVPYEERGDFFQELALALLEAKADDERLAYAIARCDWRDWWQKYMTRQHYLGGSLNRTVGDGEGAEVEFGELLVGEVDFERRIIGDLDGQALFEKLPDTIKRIVNKRIIGYALTANERQQLSRFVRSRPLILAQ